MADESSNQDSSIQKEGSSSGRARFKHQPLDLGKTQIRLFRLLDCEEEWLLASNSVGFLHGEIVIYDIEKCPEYKALSYTWGPPEPCREIIISNHTFSLRENLWQFLHSSYRNLKRPYSEWFWIDQICIDQSEVEERNHQVGLMASIYRKADLVLVWLGIEADGSDEAMETIASPSEDSLTMYKSDMERLLQRAYWHRLWILQEILLAKDINVLCGEKMFHWNRLEDILLHGSYTGETSRPLWVHDFMMGFRKGNLESALAIVEERSQFDKNHGERMSYLLDTFCNLQCQDVRDKIYGLKSLVKNAGSMTIDYSQTPLELWGVAVSWIVVYENFLDHQSHLEFAQGLRDAMLLNEITDEFIEKIIGRVRGKDPVPLRLDTHAEMRVTAILDIPNPALGEDSSNQSDMETGG